MIITGIGFTGATAVDFGGVAGTDVTAIDGSHIKVTSPAQSAGTVDVTVTTPFGTSAVVTADQFTYESMPSSYVVTSTEYNPDEPGTLGDEIAIAAAFNDAGAVITFAVPNDSTIRYYAPDASPVNPFGPTAYLIDSGLAGLNITIDGAGAPGLEIDGNAGAAVRCGQHGDVDTRIPDGRRRPGAGIGRWRRCRHPARRRRRWRRRAWGRHLQRRWNVRGRRGDVLQ